MATPLLDTILGGSIEPETETTTPVVDNVLVENQQDTPLLNSIVPDVEPPSIVEQFKFGWESDPYNFVKNFNKFVQSRFPLGSIEISPKAMFTKPFFGLFSAKYKAPEEMWGEDFNELTPEQRLLRINAVEQQELEEKYGPLTTNIYGNSIPAEAGKVAGAILKDPLSLIPIGQTYKMAALTGGMIAGSSNAMYQLANENDFNLFEVGAVGLAGAVLTPGLLFGGRFIHKKIQEAVTKKSKELVDSVQGKIIENVAQGATPEQAFAKALTETQVPLKDFSKAMKNTGEGLFFPKSPKDAAELLSNTESAGIRPWKSGNWLDDLIEPIISRVKDISEPVFKRLSELEMNVHMRPYTLSVSSQPFFKAIRKLSSENKVLVKRAWVNGDLETIERVFAGNQKAIQSFKSLRGVLDEMFSELKHYYGKDIKHLTDYLPRFIDDLDGLLTSLGSKQREGVEKAIVDAYKKSGKTLSTLEKQDIINKALRGYPREGSTLGAVKGRKIDTVPDKILDYYADPEKAFHIYVRRAVTDIEKRKFFGRHIKVKKGINTVDMEDTIAAYVSADEALVKNPDKLNELQQLLQARFTVGERSMSEVAQLMRNIGYASMLGHFRSAITQLQDIAFTAVDQGIWNAVKALTGKAHIRSIDLGLRQASEELAESSTRSAKALEKILKLVQFERVDQLGKTVNLNASLMRHRKLVHTSKGIKDIEKRYGNAFGDEFGLLVDDLQTGKITERVKLLLWSELERIQPISKSSLPLRYHEMRDGRMFYMLQSFALKQLDFARRTIYNEFKAGNIREGAANLARFSTYLTVTGMGTHTLKQWITGRDVIEEDLPIMFGVNFFKHYAASELVLHRIFRAESTEQAVRALGSEGLSFTIPIMDVVQKAWGDVAGLLREEDTSWSVDEKPRPPSSLQYIPIVGPFLYYFLFGGLEKHYDMREKDEQRKAKWAL